MRENWWETISNALMKDVPRQSDHLVTGAFTHGVLPGTLSRKFLGKRRTTRQEMNERVHKYLQKVEGTTTKEANLRAATP